MNAISPIRVSSGSFTENGITVSYEEYQILSEDETGHVATRRVNVFTDKGNFQLHYNPFVDSVRTLILRNLSKYIKA